MTDRVAPPAAAEGPGERRRERWAREFGRLQLTALDRALRTASGVRQATTEVDGLPVALLRREQPGVPLVFVHGFGGDKETWLLTALALRRQHPLVMIDLPGHGKSGRPEAPLTPHRYAAWVRAVLDKLAIDRCVFVGNSMGGGIGLALAHAEPARVSGLVLVGSMGPGAVHDPRFLAWRDGDNPLIPGAGADAHEAFARLVMERPPPVPKSVIAYIANQRAARRPALQRMFAELINAASDAGAIPTDLTRVVAPVAVIHGAQDRVIDPAVAHAIARALPNARVDVWEGIGHVPQLEDPRRMAQVIDRMAREVRR